MANTSSNTGSKIVNILGSFGYLSVLIQWCWVLAIIVLPYMQHSSFKSVFLPVTPSTSHTSSTPAPIPESVQVIALIGAMLFVIIVIAYAIYAIPRSVGKLGKQVTRKSAAITVEHIKHHHQPLSEVEKKRAFERVTWLVKIGLITFPFIISLLPKDQTLSIPHDAALIVSLFCLSMSALWFLLQYLASLLWRVPAKKIW